ncbi:MAG: MBL fold metallo-hydrolase [Desulfobacteraceae bacterium]|nr:MBL fold metallo-hydrolase [Desulfobacteraceae bacterium]
MRITTLIENRASTTEPNLVSEWGLSLHIAFNDHSILFDTGTSGSFADNAERLSVNVDSVEAAVLSHHHFDHGGGLRRFLELNSKAKVYLAEVPNGECYIKILGLLKKYIGLDKSIMTKYRDRFETVSKPTEILPDVFVFPHILSNHPKPIGNKQLHLRNDVKLIPDDFAHEIVMAIKDNGKLVIFTGCSHNGILNMVDTVVKEFEGVPIKAVIGGFHLVTSPPFHFMARSRREVENLGKSILNYPIDVTYTGHCTGTKAFGVLKSVMAEKISDFRTGSCFEV